MGSFPGNSAAEPGGGRIASIDAVRGLAVLAMIAWHTADAWLFEDARESAGLSVARFAGGMAAPAFFLLAGISLALAMPARIPRPDVLLGTAAPALGHRSGPSSPGTDRRGWVAAARRGARIVVAGYALNLWAWAIDRGAVLESVNYPTIAASLVAMLLAAAALRDRETEITVRAALAMGSICAAALASIGLGATSCGGAWLVPRLDVLHGIGAALIATALVLHVLRDLGERARIVALAAIAIAIASISVLAIGAPQRALPSALADWIARGAPWPAPTSSGFPLLPWLVYSIAGAAIGRAARGAPIASRWALPRIARPWLLAAIAIPIGALIWEPMPLARAILDRADWARSLFRLAFNGTVIAAAFGLIAAIPFDRARATLALLGRSSLLLYAVHLEFAFGLAGVPLRRALDWDAWALGASLLILSMIGLAWGAEQREKREQRERTNVREGVHSTA